MAIPGSQPPTTAPVAVGVRLFYTALGAAGLIFGAFQHWTRHLDGTELPWGGLSQDTINPPDNAMRTLGAAAIALGLLAVAGLADASGMLTRCAAWSIPLHQLSSVRALSPHASFLLSKKAICAPRSTFA